MKENEAHSPLPFRAKSTLVLDVNGLIVADTYRTVLDPAKKRDQETKNEINAAFIAQRVNNYTALLEAANKVVDWYEGRIHNGPEERTAMYEAAKAAIAEKDQPS